jgi:hypothetical protein
MGDPLSQVIELLRPRTVFTKRISGAGRWGVRYSEFGQPSFGAVLEGRCLLAVDSHPALTLEAGDFVLLPATPGFTLSGFEPVSPSASTQGHACADGEVRHGTRGGRPDVRLLGGYFVFDSPDRVAPGLAAAGVVHVRGVERLSVLVRTRRRRSRATRGRAATSVLTRLVEVLLIEALRATRGETALRASARLADARLAPAIRQMHASSARRGPWPSWRRVAALSRSAFFERFTRTVGLPPMEYLLAWRMAVARGSAPPHDLAHRRGRRARRLRLGEHLQHRLQPARGPASQSVRPAGG